MSVSSISGLGFEWGGARRIDPSAANALSAEELKRQRENLAAKSAYSRTELDQGAAAAAAARNRSQETLFNAQSLGQGIETESDGEDDDAAELAAPSPEQAFLDYMKKPAAERMIDDILKSMGLTKEDLAKMSPEDRAKVEALIKEKVEQAMAQGVEKKQKEEAAAV